MLPYFKRAEDNERGESELHGAGGPLPVSDGRSLNPLAQDFVDAAQRCGHAANDDFNGPGQDGVGLYQLTQRGGARASAAVAYLHPVMDRPNLTVETHVHALSLIFEGERAVGVLGAGRREPLEFRAEREVIVSCGAYNSPQLLMLSGLGRPAELEQLQIEVVAELPAVGLGLDDHPNAGAVYGIADEVSLFGAMNEENLALFESESRGYVALGSPDPTAKPLIVHNYLEHPDDVASLVAGVRMAMEICATEPLADEDILAKSRAHMQTLYHPVGTCAIDAVVDRELRVLGIEGLRVVDASVMPSVPRGNTNAPVIALAERASDLIRGRTPLRGPEEAEPGAQPASTRVRADEPTPA